MSKSTVIGKYDKSPKVSQIAESIKIRENKIHLPGLLGSSVSFVVNSLFVKSELPFLLILNDKEEAAFYLNDLEQLVDENDVLVFSKFT